MTFKWHIDSLQQLRDALWAFAAARNWGQFHSPKNLGIAVSVEAGELLEQSSGRPKLSRQDLSPDWAVSDLEYHRDNVLLGWSFPEES